MNNPQIIHSYFPNLSEKQKEQFAKLGGLYADWNSKINVISRKDIDNFYERHVLHSLGIAKVISFKPKTKILDAGTGGGFPGIPLAILFPECEFHLVDSIGKKIKVVNAVTESLELKNVKGIWSRVEELKEKYHFVVSRAVAELSEFQKWVKGKCLSESFNELKNGILYLKGGEIEEEKKRIKVEVKEFNLKNYFSEEFFETKKAVYISANLIP
ncbi:MAG: 16S rRNA (guanine(527)-N(7))-methyltransferase RsmG [Bacteroidetes bacterium]|nr:16S rRNA (guanine(527)-N(7))-methyltransferase RsmG [Bacteroidota bacterium]